MGRNFWISNQSNSFLFNMTRRKESFAAVYFGSASSWKLEIKSNDSSSSARPNFNLERYSDPLYSDKTVGNVTPWTLAWTERNVGDVYLNLNESSSSNQYAISHCFDELKFAEVRLVISLLTRAGSRTNGSGPTPRNSLQLATSHRRSITSWIW